MCRLPVCKFRKSATHKKSSTCSLHSIKIQLVMPKVKLDSYSSVQFYEGDFTVWGKNSTLAYLIMI